MATKPKQKVEEVVEEASKVAEEVSTNGKEDTKPFVEALHKVLLASIGAVAIAQEEIEDFIEKLVERGEIAEKDGRKMMHDVMARRKKDVEKTEDMLTKSIEDVLEHMNLPNKMDLDSLGEKVSELTKKVEELKKS